MTFLNVFVIVFGVLSFLSRDNYAINVN